MNNIKTLKKSKKLDTSDITQISIFITLMVVCSWISIPSLIPFTMQTFAIFLILLLLGGKKSMIIIIVYIILGLIGIPVFSNFRGGIAVLFGATGGYIVGFIFQCLVYSAVTKILGEKIYIKIIALILGLITCYIIGSFWYINIYNMNNIDTAKFTFMMAFSIFVVPYIIPDILKMLLAIYIYKRLKSIGVAS